jgi:hypothetical protein
MNIASYRALSVDTIKPEMVIFPKSLGRNLSIKQQSFWSESSESRKELEC